MKITRDNYEIWFLDYLEGRLDQGGMEEVRLFLAHHPDLADELEAIHPVLTVDTNLTFPDKEQLKRTAYDDPAFFETTSIAAMEGDLTEEENNSLEKWLAKNPVQKEFFSQLESCKLQPDPEIHFPGRDQLKRKTTVIAVWTRIASVAAILLLAFFIFYPVKKSSNPTPSLTTGSIPQQVISPDKNIVAANPANHKVDNKKTGQNLTALASRIKGPKHKIQPPVTVEKRPFIPSVTLQPRSVALNADTPAFTGLIPLKVKEPAYYASKEIPLSEFLSNKLKVLKANNPEEVPTREEVTLAGLRLFTRIPGNRLTGEKGHDGRLRTISFNSQLLAFSIPVNR